MVVAGQAMGSGTLGFCRSLHGTHLSHRSGCTLQVPRSSATDYHHFRSHNHHAETDIFGLLPTTREEGVSSDELGPVAQETTTHAHTPEVPDEPTDDLVVESEVLEVPHTPKTPNTPSETVTTEVNRSPYPARARTAPGRYIQTLICN